MKRYVHAATEESLVEYTVYEYDAEEEVMVDRLETFEELDDAIEYAEKYCKENGVDAHIVAVPTEDEGLSEVRDYFEYTLGIQPNEIVWQSYEE